MPDPHVRWFVFLSTSLVGRALGKGPPRSRGRALFYYLSGRSRMACPVTRIGTTSPIRQRATLTGTGRDPPYVSGDGQVIHLWASGVRRVGLKVVHLWVTPRASFPPVRRRNQSEMDPRRCAGASVWVQERG